MAYIHTNNRGSLFKKQKSSETSADYSGEINIEGTFYFIDGWVRNSGAGNWLAISIKKKNSQPEIIDNEL